MTPKQIIEPPVSIAIHDLLQAVRELMATVENVGIKIRPTNGSFVPGSAIPAMLISHDVDLLMTEIMRVRGLIQETLRRPFADYRSKDIGRYDATITKILLRNALRVLLYGLRVCHKAMGRRFFGLVQAHSLESARIYQYIRSVSLYVDMAHTSLTYLPRIIAQKQITQIAEQDPSSFRMRGDDLKRGDVLLAYKSLKYIRRHPGSRLVAWATRSRFTHAMMVTNVEYERIRVIEATPEQDGVVISALHDARPEEILFVYRPTGLSDAQSRDLQKALSDWVVRVGVKEQNTSYGFLKTFAALILGGVYQIASYALARMVVIPNPFKDPTSLFCSELVNTIFLEADIPLTPRSSSAALVGPVEMTTSPYLQFIGVLPTDGPISGDNPRKPSL